MPGSFCEYANAEYDYEWDEYLDWLGNEPVCHNSLESWLIWKGDDLPEHARELMRAYVDSHADDAS